MSEMEVQEVETVIECVAIFYEEGKGGEEYRKKNKFRCSVPKDETRLVKLRKESGKSVSSCLRCVMHVW